MSFFTRSRRSVTATGGALIAAALVLTGCGAVTPEGDTPSSGESVDSNTPITVTDDQGREVTLDGPAQTAVVLNSYGNELVRAIGAGDRVVGVDNVSLERLPYLPVDEGAIIAQGLDEINYEAVVQLDPDVVIVPRNAVWQDAVSQLETFDIPVVVATAWDYDAFEETVTLLGEVFGQEDEAASLTEFRNEIVEVVSSRVEDLERPRVYFEVDGPLVTPVPGSGFHAVIEAAGGENIFADGSGGDEQEELDVEPAEVVLRDPEFILHELPPAATPIETSEFEALRSSIVERPGFGEIDAVRNDRVLVTSGWATSALAKSIGTLYLATWLHPEAFADIDPDTYLERWVTEYQDTEFVGADGYLSIPSGVK